ncbi:MULTISPECIES: hypothetical protein [Bacillus]|uniref:hypothetical protein n=1 Tax=Bacillus TaxID=1386 RepID=UPI000F04998C|nr:hypothetical protein [Bacillus safensis]MED4592291.1 hypothetical protein [Bacillus safensis]MED4636580.1 hypothetical protein [Bacillus safensis]VCT98357.1 hypothetical protein AIDNDMCJ_14665 [Bacillus safensis]
MAFSNSARSGDNGTSIVGNENKLTTVNLGSQTPKILKRSVIFDVCKIIAELDIDYDDEYSIHNNSDWMEKFEHNKVKAYVEIFDNYSDGYDEVSKVLHGYLKKSIMVKKIRTVYLEVEKVREDEKLDGDYVINQVFRRIKEEVWYNALINESDLIDEEVDEAIYLIMFYAFTKCKLLKPVPKDVE